MHKLIPEKAQGKDFIILNFLNKKESKVIRMREFEIILLQTQSLSIKPFN
jgi:hypothetical protein